MSRSCRQIFGVSIARCVRGREFRLDYARAKQIVGNGPDHTLDHVVGQPRRQLFIRRVQVTGFREKHMVPYELKRRACANLVHRRPVMLRVKRRAMVDQKRLAATDHEIRIAVCPVGIRHERIEPHDSRGKILRNEIPRRVRVEVECAIEIARPEVDSVAGAQKVLYLGIRLRATKRFDYIDQGKVGSRQACAARQESGNDLRNERLHALPRAAEFHDEHSAAVGIDDSGQRSALSQWLDVARRGMNWQLDHS